MKWMEIREQYPKSWELFKGWIEANYEAPWETENNEVYWSYYAYTPEELRDRMLFDFFDLQDVLMWAEPYSNEDDGEVVCWSSAVSIGNSIEWNYDFKNRVEAENDCYKRAFEFLEKLHE